MGQSAVGVVRVSGPAAVPLVDAVLKAGTALARFPPRRVRRVTVVDPACGEPVDDALCVVMRAPRSYTGEDTVELSCHGSPALLDLVTRRLVAAGARLADPGEFTRRAFLNGRIDLAQAEAVGLLIGARSECAVRLAARALGGELSARIRALREAVLDVVAGLEVTLDFPDDHVGLDAEKARAAVARLHGDVGRWCEDARRGRIVQEGASVAIVGAPNAGKSSLLNALVGRERAIVSPVPGTTRDVVEGVITLAGVPVRLLDTAGLDHPRDVLEAEGIRRSHRAIEESDLLLVVLDGSVAPDAAVLEATRCRDRVIVRAKSDLPAHPDTARLADSLGVSALTGAGIGALMDRIESDVRSRAATAGDEGGLVASLRQVEALDALGRALGAAESALAGAPVEVALVDLRSALETTSSLLGIEVGDAVLGRIFSAFCLGK